MSRSLIVAAVVAVGGFIWYRRNQSQNPDGLFDRYTNLVFGGEVIPSGWVTAVENAELPEFDAPELPSFDAPELPQVNSSDIPSLPDLPGPL
jgi:hypothetical protein